MPNPILIREGDFLDIKASDVLPYKHIKYLGSGGSAHVDMVQDTISGLEFAHKIFRTYNGPGIEGFKIEFQNEIDIMKRLSPHRHIIRVIASYIRGRDFGMILTPVADGGDLAGFLRTISDSKKPPAAEQCAILERAFGCLASGLSYIHKHTIRHKDIKPQNILIHQGLVIYTDFGIALDASKYGDTTTYGTVQAFTRHYCAPEVAKSAKRNRKADVFSLGCVFAEILAALEPQIKLGDLKGSPYSTVVHVLRDILKDSEMVNSKWCGLVRVCFNMLEPEPEDRISADGLLNELNILRNLKMNPLIKYFCNSCVLGLLKEQQQEDESSDITSCMDQQQFHEAEERPKVKSHLTPQLQLPEEQLQVDESSDVTSCIGQQQFQEAEERPEVKNHTTLQLQLPEEQLQVDESSDITSCMDHQQFQEAEERPKIKKHRTPRLQVPEGHSDWIEVMTFSPGAKLMVYGFLDKTLMLWGSATGALRRKLEGQLGLVGAVAFSLDGKLLASGSSDGTVMLWDSPTGVLRGKLKGHLGLVAAVASSPDGKLVASGSRDKSVMLWDSATGARYSKLKGHRKRVGAVAFSPDSKLVASGSWDKTVMLWDSATGKQRRKLEGHSNWVEAVVFSPDGRLVASGSWDKTVMLWDSATGALRRKLEGHSGVIKAMTFSPDGKLLASGSLDGTVMLWDSATGALRSKLVDHSGWVEAVAI